MPLPVDNKLPTGFPTPSYLTLGNFKRGVITLIDKSRLPKDALQQADNIFLKEDGQPSLRPGVDWYGSVSPNAEPWDGMDYFDAAGVIHLVGVAGGVIYRSIDNAVTWTECTGYTMTPDIAVNMNQYNDNLYLTNGTDAITLYDGTTTLIRYTVLSTPAAPTVSEVGTLGGSGYKFYYKIARVNEIGFSIASDVGAVNIETNLERASWSTTNYAQIVTPLAIATQTRWDLFISTDAVNFYYLSSATAVSGAAATINDDGTALINYSTTAPTASTATGPLVKELIAPLIR